MQPNHNPDLLARLEAQEKEALCSGKPMDTIAVLQLGVQRSLKRNSSTSQEVATPVTG